MFLNLISLAKIRRFVLGYTVKSWIFILAIALFSFIIASLHVRSFALVRAPNATAFPHVTLEAIEQSFDLKLKTLQIENSLNRHRGKVVNKVKPKSPEKFIALTFDDGPDGKTTLQVLDILNRYSVKVTFFLIGNHVKKYPYVVRRLAAAGHAIGNHTLTHAYQSMDRETAQQEIEETSRALAQLTAAKPLLFRPPLGRMNNGLVDYAKSSDYITVLWSINSEDAVGYPGVRTIAQNVIDRAHSGGIVLLHDAPWYRWKTIAALPTIIEGLKAQGYRFVTVPQLLALGQD